MGAGGNVNRYSRNIDYTNLDRGESFQAGGTKGVLRKVFDCFPNLTEKQKESWSTLTFAAAMGV